VSGLESLSHYCKKSVIGAQNVEDNLDAAVELFNDDAEDLDTAVELLNDDAEVLKVGIDESLPGESFSKAFASNETRDEDCEADETRTDGVDEDCFFT